MPLTASLIVQGVFLGIDSRFLLQVPAIEYAHLEIGDGSRRSLATLLGQLALDLGEFILVVPSLRYFKNVIVEHLQRNEYYMQWKLFHTNPVVMTYRGFARPVDFQTGNTWESVLWLPNDTNLDVQLNEIGCLAEEDNLFVNVRHGEACFNSFYRVARA